MFPLHIVLQEKTAAKSSSLHKTQDKAKKEFQQLEYCILLTSIP